MTGMTLQAQSENDKSSKKTKINGTMCKTVTEGGDIVVATLDMCCKFGMRLESSLDHLPLE